MTGNQAPADPPGPHRPGPSRRALLTTSLGVLAGAAVGVGAAAAIEHDDAPMPTPNQVTSSQAQVHGAHQAGIDRPSTPQTFALFQIADLTNPADLSFLADLGNRIASLIADPPPGLLPDGPQGLTVTIGLGPRVITAADKTLPGAQPLPAFAADHQIPPDANGGDVLIACCANDPSILPAIVDDLLSQVPAATPRWSQFGYRGPGTGTVARNPLGFLDGISVPHTAKELARNVWVDGSLAGGTICVIRRLRLNIKDFTGLPTGQREHIIGRRLDGVPLSGGRPDDEVNLDAKNPDGTYLIPTDAHVRLASPLRTGSHHMLRRSYSFDNGADDTGLLFTSYQRDLRTFTITQQQLDGGDQLMKYVTPTGSATFLILPGYTPQHPLGTALTPGK